MTTNIRDERIELTAVDKFSAVFGRMDTGLNRLQSSINTMKGVAGALGVTLGAGAFVAWIKGAIDAEAAMGKLAGRSGESVETFSAMAYAMKKAGEVDAETFQSSLKKLDKVIAEAAAGGKEAQGVFRALGLEFKDRFTGEVRKGSEVMLDLADAFAKAKDDPVKVAYALKLMGKGGDEMVPGLNKGKQALLELMEQAREFGKIITKEEAEGAREFNKNLEDLSASSAKLGRSLANDLLPALKASTDEILRAKKESGFWGGIIAGLGQLLFNAMGGIHEPINRAAQDVVKLDDELGKLEAHASQLKGLGPAVNEGVLARLNADIAAKRKELEEAQKWFERVQAGARAIEAGTPPPKVKGALDASGLKNQSEAQAEIKRFISALQALERKYFDLTHAGEAALLMWETQKGSLRELTPAHKAELAVMAQQIDAYNRAILIRDQYVQAFEHQVKATEDAREAIQDLADEMRGETQDFEFQISLIGRSAREQERMNAARAIDLDIRRRIAALPKDDSAATGEATAEILRLGDARKKSADDFIKDRQKKERDWLTGAKQGYEEYLETVRNAAASTKELFTDAFRGAEDAFVQFVTTGKIEGKNLARQLEADFARLFYRKAVSGEGGLLEAANKGLTALVGSIFGGGRQHGGPVEARRMYEVSEGGPEMLSAGGRNYLMMGSQSGQVSPAGAGGGGQTINIYPDLRGASVEAIQALHRMVIDLRASVPSMSLAAVANANLRGRRW